MNHVDMTKLVTEIMDRARPMVLERRLSAIAAETLAAALIGRGAVVGIVDAATVTSKGNLLGQLAGVFTFPEYFGNNWDAALDCLSDFSWLPAPAYVCIVVHAQMLQRNQPLLRTQLVHTWEEAARRWKARPGKVVFKLVLAQGEPQP